MNTRRIALIVTAVCASLVTACTPDAPRYLFCSINAAPTFAVPDARMMHVSNGIMHAVDMAGARYALRLREGEVCTLETAPEVTP